MSKLFKQLPRIAVALIGLVAINLLGFALLTLVNHMSFRVLIIIGIITVVGYFIWRKEYKP